MVSVAGRDASHDPKHGRMSEWRWQRWMRSRHIAENEGGHLLSLSPSPSPQACKPTLCETERTKQNSDHHETDHHESLYGETTCPNFQCVFLQASS